MTSTGLAISNDRREDRDEVHYRTVATVAADRELSMLVVNVSPGGLMARCDAALAAGDTLSIRLPGAHAITATIRWALGGRIGCEFATPFAPARYFAMLPQLR